MSTKVSVDTNKLTPLILESNPNTAPKRRFDSIDGLRGLACLMVLLYHSWDHFGKSLWPTVHILSFNLTPARLFDLGYGGVDLFFVLSGFCLAYPILSRPERKVDWKRYFINRVRRIIPPYWFALLLFGSLSLLIRSYDIEPFVSQKTIGWPGVRQLTYSIFLVSTSFNSSFWTLPLEWRWYFIFPVLVWLWHRVFGRGVFILTVVISAMGIFLLEPSHLERLKFLVTGLPMFLPLFALGIWGAQLASQSRTNLLGAKLCNYAHWALLTSILLVAVYAPISMNAFDSKMITMRLLTWGPLCFSAVIAATQEGLFKRLMSWRPLVWVGMFSYSLYLTHEPFVRAASAIVLPLHWTAMAQFLFSQTLLPAALIGFGLLFFLIAEKPFLRKDGEQGVRARTLSLRGASKPEV